MFTFHISLYNQKKKNNNNNYHGFNNLTPKDKL